MDFGYHSDSSLLFLSAINLQSTKHSQHYIEFIGGGVITPTSFIISQLIQYYNHQSLNQLFLYIKENIKTTLITCSIDNVGWFN